MGFESAPVSGSVSAATDHSIERCAMKAAMVEDGSVHVRDVPAPTPGDQEALVRIAAAGVCHSDLHMVRRARPSGDAARTRGDRDRRGPRAGCRALRRRRRPCHPRPRRHGWVLVRGLRVLPARPAAPLPREQADPRHVRGVHLALGAVARARPRGDHRPRRATRVRRTHRLRRREEARGSRRAARSIGSRSSAPPAGSGTTPCRSPPRSGTR